MFANEYTDNAKIVNPGIINVTEIIKTFLANKPKSKNSKNKEKIHFLIGYNSNAAKWTFNKITCVLKCGLQEFNSNYNIQVELLAYKDRTIDGDTRYWKDSHNRWIITNNATITVEHMIHVFRNEKSFVDQDIHMDTFYSSGLDSNEKCLLPITGHIERLDRLKVIIDDIDKHSGNYQYCSLFDVDGKNNDKIIKNRLLISKE